MWGWALCILSLGRSVCVGVWEYVQGCQVVQLLHLFVYFNVSLLGRLISVFLKFILCYFLNVCNICVFMCNI